MDIDAPVLRDLKRLQRKERKTLGKLISELLCRALAQRESGQVKPARFHWVARPMRARVDVLDKEALWRTLDSGSKS